MTLVTRMDPRISQRFRMAAPVATHRREATCREVDCKHWLEGWLTAVPINSPQALYIRYQSGRKFAEAVDGDRVVFKFYPGQKCFRTHTTSLDRPPILFHQTMGPPRRIFEGQEFNDTYNEEMYKISKS